MMWGFIAGIILLCLIDAYCEVRRSKKERVFVRPEPLSKAPTFRRQTPEDYRQALLDAGTKE